MAPTQAEALNCVMAVTHYHTLRLAPGTRFTEGDAPLRPRWYRDSPRIPYNPVTLKPIAFVEWIKRYVGKVPIHCALFLVPLLGDDQEQEKFLVFYRDTPDPRWTTPNPINLQIRNLDDGVADVVYGPLLFARVTDHDETIIKIGSVGWGHEDMPKSRLPEWVNGRLEQGGNLEVATATHSLSMCRRSVGLENVHDLLYPDDVGGAGAKCA